MGKQYDMVFGQSWPVIPAALFVGTLNVFLFAFDRPWTASDGFRHWGDWLFQLLGVVHRPDLISPLLYSGSVLNIGLFLGGLVSALLSREFGLRLAPGAELIKGAIAGLMMGCGAMLSFGCNIGGFFSALSALSLSGISMMIGLSMGAFIATRYLIRENAKLIESGKTPFPTACNALPRALPGAAAFTTQPIVGTLLLIGLLGAGFLYGRSGHGRLAAFLFFGVTLGVVLQRSRFCLVNAFREPFMTGTSEHTRAAALALILSMVGFSILKATDLKDASEWVFPSFWLGSALGGTIFGIGMVIAGGCGAGSIWRAGEGHVKLWVAVVFFAIGASAIRLLLVRTELIRELGAAVFLPNVFGWAGTIWAVAILMIVWYLVSGWNEQQKQQRVLKF